MGVSRSRSGIAGNKPLARRAKSPRNAGLSSDKVKKPVRAMPRDLMGSAEKIAGGSAMIDDPRKAGTGDLKPLTVSRVSDPRQAKTPLTAGTRSDIPAEPASVPSYLGGADVMPVGDLNWRIVGTGDFNRDGNVDILWRNAASGSNVVWFMNGAEWSSSAELLPVGDMTWQIVGTGDFNLDGNVDILWRNGSSGSNVVWYMNGANWIGSVDLLGVSDLNWQIVGTGDFNKDGNVDILWRFNGAGGYNVVWYLDHAAWTGSAELIPVGDLDWQIVGTGDYNKDGNVDILWRYDGAGGYVYIWYLNGVQWIGGGDLLPVGDLTWRIVSR
jgi:hypothetical protein